MDCWFPIAEQCTCHLLVSQVSEFTCELFLIFLSGVRLSVTPSHSAPFVPLSFRYKLSDEPRLDGQDQDAAGEKVCTTLTLNKVCLI